MYRVNGKDYPCRTSLTMGTIGGKRKIVILFHLMEGPLRYNELRKQMESVTERTLSLQLKTLEEDGVFSMCYSLCCSFSIPKCLITRIALKVFHLLCEPAFSIIK